MDETDKSQWNHRFGPAFRNDTLRSSCAFWNIYTTGTALSPLNEAQPGLRLQPAIAGARQRLETQQLRREAIPAMKSCIYLHTLYTYTIIYAYLPIFAFFPDDHEYCI